MTDDKELILNVKSGSEYSYGILYRLWISRLYNFVYHYVRSDSIASDIVQETFLRIWTNRASLDPESSFKAYLFTISYRLMIKELRRQMNNPLMDSLLEYQSDWVTSENETGRQIEIEQFREALVQAKKKLTPRLKLIFEMNKEQNISVADIAKKLGITEQVVRNQLSVAVKVIRGELQHYLFLLCLFFYF